MINMIILNCVCNNESDRQILSDWLGKSNTKGKVIQ